MKRRLLTQTKKKHDQKQPKTCRPTRKHYETGRWMNLGRDYYKDEGWLIYYQNYHNYQRFTIAMDPVDPK